MSETYKLGDVTIIMVRQLLQMSMLTGTDIVDHMRMVELEKGPGGVLVPTAEYRELFQGQIESMNEELEKNEKR